MNRLGGFVLLGMLLGRAIVAGGEVPPMERPLLCDPGDEKGPFVTRDDTCAWKLIPVPIAYNTKEGKKDVSRPVSLRSCGHGANGTCELASRQQWQTAAALSSEDVTPVDLGLIALAPIPPSGGETLITTLQEWITSAAANLQAVEFAWRLYMLNAQQPLFRLPAAKTLVPFGGCERRPIGSVDVSSDQIEPLILRIVSTCRPNVSERLFTEHLEPAGTKTWKFNAGDRIFNWELEQLDTLRTVTFQKEAAITIKLFDVQRDLETLQALYTVPMVAEVTAPMPVQSLEPTAVATEVTERRERESADDGHGWLWGAGALVVFGFAAAVWVRQRRRATIVPEPSAWSDEGGEMGKGRNTAVKVEAETAKAGKSSASLQETSGKQRPRSFAGSERSADDRLDREIRATIAQVARDALQPDLERVNVTFGEQIKLSDRLEEVDARLTRQIETATRGAVEDAARKMAASLLEQWKEWLEKGLKQLPPELADRPSNRFVVVPEAKGAADAFMDVCRFVVALHRHWVGGGALRTQIEAAWRVRARSEDVARYQSLRDEQLDAIMRGVEAVLAVDFPLANAVQWTLAGAASPDINVLVSAARHVWPHDWNDPEDVRRFVRDWVSRRVPALQTVIEALPIELRCLEPTAAGLVPALAAFAASLGYGDHAAVRGTHAEHPGAYAVVSERFHSLVTSLLESADTEYSPIRLHQDGLQSKEVSALQRRGHGRSLEYDSSALLVALGVNSGHGTVVRVTQPSIRYRPAQGGTWETEGTILYLRVPHVAG